MAEPTVSMRERIAKALAEQEDRCSPERWDLEGDLYRSEYLATADYLLRTVLSQPTPTAELIACPHWEPGQITMRKGCTACAANAAPPSIADMVPGATFTARHVDPEECGGIERRWFIAQHFDMMLAISDEGQRWSPASIDPSTIRDVTPPPTTGPTP
ncbi:hypothetical protein [Curtobacterium sp. USHLN213]|uniref:hypothetical protein n=1 Tax=Curtobacterium sp. USHLN213 TaxID=3081255 RepID=UPI003019D819